MRKPDGLNINERKTYMKKSLIIGKRQFLLAALILLLALAVYLNWQFSKGNSQGVTDVYAGGNMGEAVLVDSDSASESDDYFSTSKKERAENRKKQLEELKEIAENVKTDSDSAAKANEQMVKISGFREKENNIETLVKAKGFEKCVAVVNDTEVSIVVKTDGLLQSDMLQIQEIAAGETGFELAKIKIIEIKQ